VRASRFLAAIGVILVGLCAALPFRHSSPRSVAPLPAPAPLELTLRRPDAPLRLAPTNEISPAVGLEQVITSEKNSLADPRALAASARAPDLSNLVPPPALPVSFQPGEMAQPPGDWRPEPLARPTRPQGKPRAYRLRDGDTLESIAERFLGTRARAEEIFAGNRNVLARPDLLPVGTTIIIPPRSSADDLEPVKRD
jgi:nucleoid-associated protein YgaU